MGSRGGRLMISRSFGSKTSISPSRTAVVMLIQRICTGRIGSVVPAKTAVRMTRPSPKLVGRVQTMNLVRLSKTPRSSSTAASMEAKLPSVSIMSAASFDTSVPVIPMAVPMSACLSAGASFTPSPAMATTWPRDCNALTRRSFCSGATRAKTEERSAASANSSSLSFSKSRPVRAMMSAPLVRPICPAMALAVRMWSPVIIFTRIPAVLHFATASIASGRGGSS